MMVKQISSKMICFVALHTCSFCFVEARLGEPNVSLSRNEESSGVGTPSVTALVPNIEESLLNMTLAVSAFGQGASYQYVATTTRYGDADASACGGMSTAAVVAGTDYYQVASAQAMQGGDCCWCGRSSSSNGHGSGTAPMGCFQCAKGRFTRRTPCYALYAALGGGMTSSSHTTADDGFASEEINVVVADLCPHVGNEHWCPAKPGQANAVGSKNHFDFSHPPDGVDNNYFVFTPTECSPQLKTRMKSLSKCQR